MGNTDETVREGLHRTVHPHACGEHVQLAILFLVTYGSSPRMWGTHRSAATHLMRFRFIPTHVGNTCGCSGYKGVNPVHPHACGEHKFFVRKWHNTTGSSPRMWGTRIPRCARCGTSRFIPTHVGNTCRSVFSCHVHPVHPHACGEHSSPIMNNLFMGGSSPRMWGTQQ